MGRVWATPAGRRGLGLPQGPNGDVGCWIPNWERPGIGIPITQVTKPRIPARISMKKTIQRNIPCSPEGTTAPAGQSLGQLPPRRNWSLEPAAAAVIEKLQGGRPDHDPDRQQPERPGRRDMAHQPGEVHPEEAGNERQWQEERGENGQP